MTKRALIIGGVAVALVLVALVAFGARGARHSLSTPPQEESHGITAKAPPLPDPKWANGQRVTVEVLNATRTRGLARRAAIVLRDQGFDVVSTGTNHDQFDSTQVLDRTGHREWAVLASKAMGGGTVLVRSDSSRQVDLTVLIGATWRPPSQPFYP